MAAKKLTSAKVVTRVAVGAGRNSVLQGANAAKYRQFAIWRIRRERKHRQFPEVLGETTRYLEIGNHPGRPPRARADCSKVR